ncbi:hypothetical protein BJX99DRAFT_257777 [Aspergillus californicus]
MQNPLLIPEILILVLNHLDTARDLLNCCCVNHTWSSLALEKLYEGSLHEEALRTPSLKHLKRMFSASPQRLKQHMRSVKHFLLSPKVMTSDYGRIGSKPFTMWPDECCSITELLLRTEGRALESISIPYFTLGVDHIPTTVQYLAINSKYCELLYTGHRQQDQLSNIKALTLYYFQKEKTFHFILDLLERVHLTFFHLELIDELSYEDDRLRGAEFIASLKRQRNLQALLLPTGSLRTLYPYRGLPQLDSGMGANPWPTMKAVQIYTDDRDWMEQCLNMPDDLEILNLKYTDRNDLDHGDIWARFGKCQSLRAISLEIEAKKDPEAFLQIPLGCPRLQMVSLKYTATYTDTCMYSLMDPHKTEKVLLGLVRKLPLLEVLELNWRCTLRGSWLRDFTQHCPQLKMLSLPGLTTLFSYADLANTCPHPHLEVVHIGDLRFDKPYDLINTDKVQSLAREWRRVFPKTQGMPRDPDIDCPGWWQKALLRRIEERGGIRDSEPSLAVITRELQSLGFDLGSQPPLEESDEGYDAMRKDLLEKYHDANALIDRDIPDYVDDLLLVQIWEAAGYGGEASRADKYLSRWLTNLEIEVIGWPVIPFESYESLVEDDTASFIDCICCEPPEWQTFIRSGVSTHLEGIDNTSTKDS